MMFNEERLSKLQIKPEYKQRIRMICSNPDTKQQCQVLSQTPDNKLIELFSQIEGKMKQWQEKGTPPELDSAMRQEHGSAPQRQSAPVQAPGGIQSIPQMTQGGPPQMAPQQKPVPQGMAPSQMSRTPSPMDTPPGGIGGVRR
jgi:hypothetical protein